MSRRRSSDEYLFGVLLGGNLKFCRLSKAKFMPQKCLAAALGVTHQQINKYEAGKNIPSAYRLKQMAAFYKVNVDELVNPGFIYNQTKELHENN
jgi:transcriptional regulator with XRE-family HTH domain